MKYKKILSAMQKTAHEIDWNSSFGGKSKGNKHLSRIVIIAKYLTKNTNADRFIVEAGALLHDIALPSGNDYDYKKNKRIAKKLLTAYNLTANEIEAIAECIAAHEGIIKPKTIEAKIVHDADVLEKSGMLGIIRHTWKLTNLNKINSEKISHSVARRIYSHVQWRGKNLQTPEAKKIHKKTSIKLKEDQLHKIVIESAQLAKKGIITEEIAKLISTKLTKEQREKLSLQLNPRLLTDNCLHGKKQTNVP